MSIIIHTVDLPDRCYDCPCYDPQNSCCKADLTRRSTYEWRPFWCPAEQELSRPQMTVPEYNNWYLKMNRAFNFIHNIDHALQKSDENARMQFEAIGWSQEVKDFLDDSIACFNSTKRRSMK